MILHALLGIQQDAVEYTEEFAGFDGESGFFASLANGGVADHFADFKHASRDGPFGLQRRVKPFHEDDARVFDDDGSDADQRDFGKFALHGVGILANSRVVVVPAGAELCSAWTAEGGCPHMFHIGLACSADGRRGPSLHLVMVK